MRKEAIENMQRDPAEEETVQRILADTELQAILADASFRDILTQCASPGVLQRYSKHPEHGPKLKKLFEAGLVQLQH